MKLALETRKANVESINRLLMEYKAEGELTSGQFPQDVGDKIARLNADWQVIIRLAIALKERPIAEDMVVAESVQQSESSAGLDLSADDFNLDGKTITFIYLPIVKVSFHVLLFNTLRTLN